MLQTLLAGLVVLKGSMRALDAALTGGDVAPGSGPGQALVQLGAGVRIPDATLQAAVPRVEPKGIRQVLVDWVRQALRNKVLDDPPRRPRIKSGAGSGDPRPLRFAAIDGQNVYTGKEASNPYSQRTRPGGGQVCYLNRVLRVPGSSPGQALWIGPGPRLVLDQRPIAADSNDMGTLIPLLEQMEESYGDPGSSPGFLEGVSVDAGMASKENADAIEARGLAYVISLKGNQPDPGLDPGPARAAAYGGNDLPRGGNS